MSSGNRDPEETGFGYSRVLCGGQSDYRVWLGERAGAPCTCQCVIWRELGDGGLSSLMEEEDAILLA